MTANGWELVRTLANQWFGGDMTPVAFGSWRLGLPDDATPEDVTAALRRLIADGQTFMPKPGEVAPHLPNSARLDAPSGLEVVAVCEAASWGERGASAALSRIQRELGDVAAGWYAATDGFAVFRQTALGDDPYASVNRRRLVDSYEAHVQVQRERVRRGIPITTVESGRLNRGGLRPVADVLQLGEAS